MDKDIDFHTNLAEVLRSISEQNSNKYYNITKIINKANKAAQKGKTTIDIRCTQNDYNSCTRLNDGTNSYKGCIYAKSILTPLVKELHDLNFTMTCNYKYSFWTWPWQSGFVYYITIFW
jgi:hypothetical protein